MTRECPERKRTAAEIGEYFDGEVERFSDLAAGQASIKDSRLMMDLLAETAAALAPGAGEILDIGCGAGNQTLNLLRVFPDARCTLVDLSPAMLERAAERVGRAAKGRVKTVEGDFRDVPLPAGAFQAAVACAVLHHLRDAGDWERAFAKIYSLLAPGGVMLVYDLVRHDNPAVEALFRARHERFLRDALGDEEAARNLRSIAESDTPSSLEFQFGLLRKTGFREVGLLHKTVVFGAYYALK